MTSPKPEGWAEAVAAATPDLDGEGRRIVIQTYRLLSRGEPVSPGQIAEAGGAVTDRVDESLRSWPLVFRDDEERVVGFWGLSISRMQPTHAMEVGGTIVYGWCAWDTLFITEILGTETQVRSNDPRDGTPIRLTVSPDGVTDLQPPETVVSLLLPEGDLGADAIQGFCHRIHFFASPQSAEQWMADRSGLFAVSVEEAFKLGRLTNRLRLGTAIEDMSGTGRPR